jgi:hypothetical protein
MGLEHFILFCVGALSAIVTFFLHVECKLGSVKASSLVGVLIGLFVLIFPNLLSPFLTRNLPLVCFGASFVGMASSEVLSSYLLIGFSGLVFTVIFFNMSSFFYGFGGGLGSAACIAVLVSLSIPALRKQKSISKKVMEIRNYLEVKLKGKK